jgi:hypothetical protein
MVHCVRKAKVNLNFLMSVLDNISKISSSLLLNFILSRFHLDICLSWQFYHPIFLAIVVYPASGNAIQLKT